MVHLIVNCLDVDAHVVQGPLSGLIYVVTFKAFGKSLINGVHGSGCHPIQSGIGNAFSRRVSQLAKPVVSVVAQEFDGMQHGIANLLKSATDGKVSGCLGFQMVDGVGKVHDSFLCCCGLVITDFQVRLLSAQFLQLLVHAVQFLLDFLTVLDLQFQCVTLFGQPVDLAQSFFVFRDSRSLARQSVGQVRRISVQRLDGVLAVLKFLRGSFNSFFGLFEVPLCILHVGEQMIVSDRTFGHGFCHVSLCLFIGTFRKCQTLLLVAKFEFQDDLFILEIQQLLFDLFEFAFKGVDVCHLYAKLDFPLIQSGKFFVDFSQLVLGLFDFRHVSIQLYLLALKAFHVPFQF